MAPHVSTPLEAISVTVPRDSKDSIANKVSKIALHKLHEKTGCSASSSTIEQSLHFYNIQLHVRLCKEYTLVLFISSLIIRINSHCCSKQARYVDPEDAVYRSLAVWRKWPAA